jgi:arabinoxylan arabinofuranohydrolase
MKKSRSFIHNYAGVAGLILCIITIQGYANETGPDRCGKIIELIGNTNHYTNPAGYTVENATDSAMYQEEIYGYDFTALVRNLPSAEYTVSIFMAESYWSSIGQRIFNVYVEENLIIENLDIFAEVGKDAEYLLSYTFDYTSSVTNDELNIRFETIVDNSKFNAIHISRNDTIIACGMAHEFVPVIEPPGTGNPFIRHIYTADPSAHVFEGKMYVYPSHDKDNPNWFDMRDYHVFSSTDLYEWEDHGVVLDVDDVPWATEYMWAPDCAYKDGWYYFYFPAKNSEGEFRIGVATSQSPSGPFIPESESIPGSFSVDPAVFIDNDGQAYMYFGGGGHGGQSTPWVAKLANNMKEYSESPQQLTGIDYWFEACWVNKIDSVYYLSYSTGSNHPDYPSSSAIAYATSSNPMGPFTYQGIINGYVTGWTNHHSIVEYKGQWYFFYHTSDLSGGVTEQRSICADYLHFNDDGSIRQVIQTKQGIGSYNGLEKIEAENYSETIGATKHECNEGGFLISFNPNDTIIFNNVDFMEDQFSSIDSRIASDSDAGIIEICNNSNDLLGEIHVPNTGGLSQWQTLISSIQSVSGKTKIYLNYKGTEGSKVNLNWIEFTNNEPTQVNTTNVFLPKEYKLHQNYPNPFNPVTQITYTLPQNTRVKIELYDLLGKRVKVLENEQKLAGYYTLEFNGGDLASGVYFYRMQAGNFVITKKMLLIK